MILKAFSYDILRNNNVDLELILRENSEFRSSEIEIKIKTNTFEIKNKIEIIDCPSRDTQHSWTHDLHSDFVFDWQMDENKLQLTCWNRDCITSFYSSIWKVCNSNCVSAIKIARMIAYKSFGPSETAPSHASIQGSKWGHYPSCKGNPQLSLPPHLHFHLITAWF